MRWRHHVVCLRDALRSRLMSHGMGAFMPQRGRCGVSGPHHGIMSARMYRSVSTNNTRPCTLHLFCQIQLSCKKNVGSIAGLGWNRKVLLDVRRAVLWRAHHVLVRHRGRLHVVSILLMRNRH